MNWIKNRYDQLILTVVAIALLVFAGMVMVKTDRLPDRLSATAGLPSAPSQNDVGELALPSPFMGATTSPIWNVPQYGDGSDRGSLFVGPKVLYVPGVVGLRRPEGPGHRLDSLTRKLIPNRWFMDHGISFLEPDATVSDPDKDGFLNEDEWREGTDASSPDSHPPYHTKLFLKQVLRTPFRLLFSAMAGDTTKLETMEFQINTIDLRQPSSFVKIGEVVPNTGFKVTGFELKIRPNGPETEDYSELMLTRIGTNEVFPLVIQKVSNVPVKHVIFDYQWPGAAGEFPVKEGGQFGLRPETDRNLLYQVSEVTDTEVVIRLPNGQRYTVRRDPRKTDSITPKPPQP